MKIFDRFRIPEVRIYTDGSCDNHGYGGWAAVILTKWETIEISGSASNTTNNKMELTAVLEALARIKNDVDIVVYSDSQYVVSGVDTVFTWRANNWYTKCCGPVKNLDLWKRFVELVSDKHTFKAIWVKGHSNSLYNEQCDKLAKAARDKLIAKEKHKKK